MLNTAESCCFLCAGIKRIATVYTARTRVISGHAGFHRWRPVLDSTISSIVTSRPPLLHFPNRIFAFHPVLQQAPDLYDQGGNPGAVDPAHSSFGTTSMVLDCLAHCILLMELFK